MDLQVETKAQASLARRYFGGHKILFADTVDDWAGHADYVARLVRLAELMRPVESTPAKLQANDGGRVESPAARRADDARVKAYEILGERERAVSIMERRLRA